jgi:hypothetical protein
MVIETIFVVGPRWCRIVSEAWPAMKGAGVIRAQWVPDTPRKFTKREWREYRAGRHQHFLKVARAIGGTVLVVE